MTRVYRRVTPADVLNVAGDSPEDVPQLLAAMSDDELAALRELGEQVVHYVDEVLRNRRWQQIWADAGRQSTVDHDRAGHAVWTGADPSWPSDEDVTPPPVTVPDQDPERTQIIDVAAIAAEQYDPMPAPLITWACPPAGRTSRTVPVPLPAEQATGDISSPAPDGGSGAVPVAEQASSDGGTLTAPSSTGERTMPWNPTAGWDDQDWSALPTDDDTADHRKDTA